MPLSVVQPVRPKSNQPNIPPGQRNPMWMSTIRADDAAVDVELQPPLRRAERPLAGGGATDTARIQQRTRAATVPAVRPRTGRAPGPRPGRDRVPDEDDHDDHSVTADQRVAAVRRASCRQAAIIASSEASRRGPVP